MKKLAITLSLVLALAFAMAVSLPALASTTGDTEVTGTVSGIIEVTAPSGIELGTMAPGTTVTGSSATNGSVKANDNWQLTVKDKNETAETTGHMIEDEKKLANEFQINVAGQGLTGAETGATVTDSATGGTDISFAVSQVVAWTDAPGYYSITIEFVGTIN